MGTAAILELAIVGGGCRGKALCQAVHALPRIRKVHLVSRRNARGMHDWIAAQGLAPRVALHGKLDPVLLNAGIVAAVVANLPSEHFVTARWLLENGRHVLVEKPFVATQAEAQALIELAEARGLVLAVALQDFFASYVHFFRSVIHNEGHPFPIDRTEITWNEQLRGDKAVSQRPADDAADIVQESMPHVLALLTVLLGRHTARAAGCRRVDTAVVLDLHYGPHPVRVSMARVPENPRRTITIHTQSGRRFRLDFTREPGIVTRDDGAPQEDPWWTSMPRPLPAMLGAFLDEIAERHGTLPLLARETLHIVAGTEEAVARAQDNRMEALRGAPPPSPEAAPPLELSGQQPFSPGLH